MKKLVISMILLALLLCGCSEEPDPDAVDFAQCPTIATQEVDTLPILNAEPKGAESAALFLTSAENGMFYLKRDEDGGSGDTYLHFLDFGSGEAYPVCARPNCPHDDYLCSAYMKSASDLYYDGTYLYYFTGSSCQLWRMNTDGTDRTMLFECNEKAKSGATMNTLSTVYLDGMVYFNTFGGVFDPAAGTIETGERICAGDLKTGELTVLPIAFEENNGGSTLNLCGMYGNLLVIRHSNTLSSIGTYQKTEETVCLLDVNTMEVTVLCQWQWDTADDQTGVSFVTESIDEGYMIFKIYSDTYSHPTYADGTVTGIFPGDRLFVDLSEKKAYRMTEQDCLGDEFIVDGKWIYERWNQEHTFIEKAVRDLKTGEVILLPESVRDMQFDYTMQIVGDYYIVGALGEDRWVTGYMPRADYWAGKTEFTPFPEWAVMI